jgi:hypothetical protein
MGLACLCPNQRRGSSRNVLCTSNGVPYSMVNRLEHMTYEVNHCGPPFFAPDRLADIITFLEAVVGASLGAERTEIVPNTTQHHIRKSQKNKTGHVPSNGLLHLLSRGSGVRIPPGAPPAGKACHLPSRWDNSTSRSLPPRPLSGGAPRAPRAGASGRRAPTFVRANPPQVLRRDDCLSHSIALECDFQASPRISAQTMPSFSLPNE